MAASAVSGLVVETGGLTSVAVSQPSSPARDGASSVRVSREPDAGEAFTQRVQQALQSLNLTPRSTSSTQELSAVLYDLFQAMDRDGAPASQGNPNAPVLSISGSPWKPADMVSGLHTLIDQLQSQSTRATASADTSAESSALSSSTAAASTTPASTVSPTGNRNELAQLQADFAALVHGTPDTSSHMTTTLIQFLKALQQNLPAWPPSLAAVGGNVNATA